jgi:L-ascorbate metabolism protein UlaG (beta-lactamase superfamily)
VRIESGGRKILTDPVFGPRASPSSLVGPKRFHATPASIEELADVDVVLLSHDHYDHLCAPTMRALARMRMPIVTSLGVGARLEGMGVDAARIVELDWWEPATVGGVRFTAVPAQHFSGRGALDRNQTLWSSFVVQTDAAKVFFSGDTGLHDELATIAARHGPFDLVMLEVGAFHEAWGDIHLGPVNALEAFRRLGGGTLLPVHWGTFDLGLHPWDEPAELLVAHGAGARILTPKVGDVVETVRVDGIDPWWRDVTRRAGTAALR